MVSEDKLIQRFKLLDDYLDVLKEISKTEKAAFLKDKILIGSAKHYLQTSIECCLDAANHIIGAERFRAPEDYADSFSVLGEEAILSKDLTLRLRQMAKFRNRLVHLYGEIDNQFVYKAITDDVKDILQFRQAIIERFLSHDETSHKS